MKNKELLFNLIRENNVEKVEQLLKNENADLSTYNTAFMIAAYRNHFEIVKLILKYTNVDPSADDNIILRTVACKGYLEVVEILLKDKRVNPPRFTINLAAQNGHLEIVKLLLKDKRIDPTGSGGYYICVNI